MNTLNTLTKLKYEEEKQEESQRKSQEKQGKQYIGKQEAEMIEDAITGNL